MCRSIKTLFNFERPATKLENRDAALQFVRKLSEFAVPSRANEVAFEQAVAEVADGAATRLQPASCTMAPTRDAAPPPWPRCSAARQSGQRAGAPRRCRAARQ